MPVPLYLSGVVIFFIFLDFEKAIAFSDILFSPPALKHKKVEIRRHQQYHFG
jgi:hypothetical protein